MDACIAMAVIIPARNEEDLLPRCLLSVLAARDAVGADVRCEVVVVSDSSLDGTAAIAADMLRGAGVVLQTNYGNVGHARAEAARGAMHRLEGIPPELCWLANTDADCVVPPGWLQNHLRAARRRVDALAGIVDVDDFREHQAHVARRFRETYQIDTDGTHPHIHGANLGVRGDAYLRAGGWQPGETAEDHDLWRRLGETGAVRVADARLQVLTSGRRQGRAPGGFAAALAAHNLAPEAVLP